MKKIKLTIHKNGSFDVEALEGFSGTQCHTEIEKLVVSVGASVVDDEKKPEYYIPDNPESIFVKG